MTSLGSDMYVLLRSGTPDSTYGTVYYPHLYKYDSINDTWTDLGYNIVWDALDLTSNHNLTHAQDNLFKSVNLITVGQYIYIINASRGRFIISKWDPTSSDPFEIIFESGHFDNTTGILNIQYLNVCTDGVDSIFMAGGVVSGAVSSDFVYRFDISLHSIKPIGHPSNLYGFNMFVAWW